MKELVTSFVTLIVLATSLTCLGLAPPCTSTTCCASIEELQASALYPLLSTATKCEQLHLPAMVTKAASAFTATGDRRVFPDIANNMHIVASTLARSEKGVPVGTELAV